MEAISTALRAEIEAARAGIALELESIRTREEAEQEAFLAEIAGFVALTGGGWPPEQRQEFIDQAASVLADLPVSLLVPAIREAQRRVWDPKRFVSWIFERVEPDLQKRQTERELLNRLGEIAVRAA